MPEFANLSNTMGLPFYRVADASEMAPALADLFEVSAETIRHKALGSPYEMNTTGWLPRGSVTIGLTSGASTPDNLLGTTIQRLDAIANNA